MSRVSEQRQLHRSCYRFVHFEHWVGRCCARLLAMVFLLSPALASSEERPFFTFYAYHDKPPYYAPESSRDNSAEGIYAAFVLFLNDRQTNYRVQLIFQPRVRLEDKLNSGALPGAIIGVNPLWFKDRNELRFLWSGAFMWDKDIVVVHRNAAFTFTQADDLIGKKLALPRGQYFLGVSQLAAAGKLNVFETNSDLQNLQMVNLGRADATITSVLTYEYFTKTHTKNHALKAFDTPHDEYARRMLFPKTQQEAYAVLAPIIEASLGDPAWLATLETYYYRADKRTQ